MLCLSKLKESDIFTDIPEADFKGIIFHIIRNSQFPAQKKVFNAILAREEMESTAIGSNMAIPHCRLKNFKGVCVKFALFKNGVDLNSLDGKEVNFLFLVIGSEEETALYLKTLAHIVKFMKLGGVPQELLNADRNKIKQIFNKYETGA